MPTFVILSRISPQAFEDPKEFKDLAKTVSEKIKKQCPGITWKDSYATLGRFDVVDIVEGADPKEVEKAAKKNAPTGSGLLRVLLRFGLRAAAARLGLASEIP
jgi:uncharacterized protein with GYD domain